MWWLDDRPLAGNHPESIASTTTELEPWVHLLAIQSHAEEAASDRCGDLPACISDEPALQPSQLQASEDATKLARQFEIETDLRLAAETQLVAANLQHAEQLAALRLDIQALEESVQQSAAAYNELVATAKQHEAEHATHLAEVHETHQASKAALLESESQRATDANSLRSELKLLQELLQQNEGVRSDLLASLEQRDSVHAAELAKTDEARHAAVQRGEELARQRQSLQCQLESALAQADRESESRVAAETESQRLSDEVRRLNEEAEATRGCYGDLESHCTELRSQAEAERASRVRVEQEAQQLTEELTRQMAEETQQRLVSQGQITDLQTECARQKQELAASRDEISQLQKRIDAFRGLAQREAAARKKLEMAIKRAGDGTGDSLLAIRANLEVNERIRRLTTELTAARNQELSVRQRVIQRIKQAHEEIRLLKDRLANEQKAS
ncbi:MAG: hypothetical protein ABI614_13255 [Planctomycetota bacterium]